MLPTERPALISVFLLCLAVFLLTANGRIVHRDGEAVYQVARSVLDHGWFDVPVEAVSLEFQGPGTQGGSKIDIAQNTAALGTDGKPYAKYGIGLSLVSIPFLLAARAASAWTPAVPIEVLERAFVPLTNALATAATAAVLTWIALRQGYPIKASVSAGCLYAFGTFAWAHSRNYYGEPLTGLLITAAFGALLGEPFRRTEAADSRVAPSALAGTAIGLAILVRPTAILILPALIGAIWSARSGGNRWRGIAAVSGPILAALLLSGLYNAVRFGNPLDFGYRGAGFGTPLAVGLYGLLVSPGKGIFWYAPALFVAVPGWIVWFRNPNRRHAAIWLAAATGTWIVVHSTFDYWEGGWTWGPRFLLPVLPVACLPVAETVSWLRGRRARRAAVVAGTLLILSQLPPAVSDYTRYYWATYLQHGPADYELLIYRPSASPVLQQWSQAVEVWFNALTPGRLNRIRDETLALVASVSDEGSAKRSVALLDRSALNGINVPDLWIVHLWLFRAETRPLAIVAVGGALLLVFAAWLLRVSVASRVQPVDRGHPIVEYPR